MTPETLSLLLGAIVVLMLAAAGFMIWRLWGEVGRLRAQVAADDQERAVVRAAYAAPAHDPEAITAVSPVAWRICPACQSEMEVVLCPYCHAPYHTGLAGPQGGKINCWEIVLGHGRCFNCKHDLTPFQQISPTRTRSGAAANGAGGGPPRPPDPAGAAPPDDDFIVKGTSDPPAAPGADGQ